MAILKNALFRDHHGHVDKRVVLKQYADKTVMTSFPDMSGVEFSPDQIAEQDRFKQAVAYAKAIIANPVEKAAYQSRLKPRSRVFQAAIAEFMRKPLPQNDGKTIWIADSSGKRSFPAVPITNAGN